MKRLFLPFVLLLTFFFGAPQQAFSAPHFKGTVFPVYFYDPDAWSSLAALKTRGKFYAIVNPASGPGEFVDENYVKFIRELRRHRKIPIGYIHTEWGKRDISEVKEEVDRWLELYPKIRGFFIDEVATSKEELPYYSELVSYIKSKNPRFKVVFNPGTKPDRAYFKLANLVIVYENSLNNLSDMVKAGPKRKSGCIVYGVDRDNVKVAVQKAKKVCKYLFITDGSGANPYDHIPDYFEWFLKRYVR
ncbi:spherulation-specific family 4 protein [Thermovibrio sp.]